MRYSQITTRRLSHAARKLEQDGEWHLSEGATLRWYRVWQRQIVQRATFDSQEEATLLLPVLSSLDPVEIVKSEGFREELTVRMGDDAFELVVLLGRAPDDVSTLPAHKGMRYQVEDGALTGCIALNALTSDELSAAHVRMVEIRAAHRALHS